MRTVTASKLASAKNPGAKFPLVESERQIVAEALRRKAEMNSNPGIGVSLRDFERRIRMSS